MKVLMLGWGGDSPSAGRSGRSAEVGGVGSACDGISSALARIGAEVTLLTPDERLQGSEGVAVLRAPAPRKSTIPSPHPPGDLPGEAAVAQNPLVVRVASPLTPYLTQASYTSGLARLPGSPAIPTGPYAPDLLSEVQRFARRALELAHPGRVGRFQVLHAHDWMTLPAALALRELHDCPLVWHVHSTEYDRALTSPDAAIVSFEQTGFEQADRIVAVSLRSANEIEARYRIDPERVRIVHNAIDVPERADRELGQRVHPTDRPLVLFLGRLTEQKDPFTFLAAARLTAQRVPGARFVIAGAGELYPGLVERAAREGMAQRLHFTGALSAPDVERMFALADLYVMPSAAEPFGIAALEAMCASVPVIVTKESGVAEVLRNALKVDAGDVEGLAERMISLLLRPALRQTLAANGSEEVRSLRWDVRARSLLEIYHEVAS